MSQLNELAGVVDDALENRNGKVTFNLERSQGETYGSDRPGLYALDQYPRRSVLAGQTRRRFLLDWDDWDTARQDCAALRKVNRRFVLVDYGPEGGSSHRPVASMISHLPDDEG